MLKLSNAQPEEYDMNGTHRMTDDAINQFKVNNDSKEPVRLLDVVADLLDETESCLVHQHISPALRNYHSTAYIAFFWLVKSPSQQHEVESSRSPRKFQEKRRAQCKSSLR